LSFLGCAGDHGVAGVVCGVGGQVAGGTQGDEVVTVVVGGVVVDVVDGEDEAAVGAGLAGRAALLPAVLTRPVGLLLDLEGDLVPVGRAFVSVDRHCGLQCWVVA